MLCRDGALALEETSRRIRDRVIDLSGRHHSDAIWGLIITVATDSELSGGDYLRNIE